MRRWLIVLGVCMLCGCSAGNTESTEVQSESVLESVEETVVTEDVIDETDSAFGVSCRYVDGDVEMAPLKCRQHEIRTEWKTPADGWDSKETTDGKIEIHQVYDENDILLLPLDYGSNTHTIIGLDGEEETECEPCSEGE